jgi:PAS domain S-box-containing protein
VVHLFRGWGEGIGGRRAGPAWRDRHWIEKAVAGIDEALIVTDRRGRVLFLNALAESLTGWTFGRAFKRHVDEVLPLLDERTRVPLRASVLGAAPGDAVEWTRHAVLLAREGRLLPVEFRAAPIQGSRGVVEGAVLLIHDGSSRRRVEEAIAQMAAIVETTEDAVVGVTMKNVITTWNPGARRLYGYRAEEAIGRPFAVLFPPDSRELAAIWAGIERGEPVLNYDTVHLRAGQVPIEVSVSTSPIREADGRIVGLSSIARDISARKRADEERRRAELLVKMGEAQEGERRRIAHELHDQMGQHLAALKLGLEALNGSAVEHARVGSLLGIVKQMGHDMRRIAHELRPTMLDDLGLVTALLHALGEWRERSGIEVDFHHAEIEPRRLPPNVETALYRVVQEALTNVLKHAAGADRVSLVLERRPDHLLAVFEDNGAGFDCDAVAAARDGARRLGLSGMRERVEALGGTFHVETAPGEGTALFVRVPLPAGEA